MKCSTNRDILTALKTLPEGLQQTFIRSLRRIDASPDRIRLRRTLCLLICFEKIQRKSLRRLLNIAEMGAVWDPVKTINDLSKLISDCGHLIRKTHHFGKPSFTLTHLAVQQFLTSDPHSLDSTTLPQYHCYPLRDAFMETARIFAKGRQMRGCPYLMTWHDECQLVSRWRRISDCETSTSDFLSTVFNAPLNENARPGSSLVFPNATQVTAINCRFIDVEDEYYILTSSQPAEFSRGPYVLKDVFPRLTEWTSIESVFWIAPCGIHVQNDQRATTEPVGYPSPTNATHVTVKDIDFIFAKNSHWIIYPGVKTIRGVTQTEQQSQSIYRNMTVLSGAFTSATDYLISVGQPPWNEVSSENSRIKRDPSEPLCTRRLRFAREARNERLTSVVY